MEKKEEEFEERLKLAAIPDEEILFREQPPKPVSAPAKEVQRQVAPLKTLKGIAGVVRARALQRQASLEVVGEVPS
jgi:hypothetical protein